MGKLGHFGVESPTFPPPLGVVPSRRPGDHLSHQPRRKMHGRWDLGWTFMKVLPLVGVSLSLSLKLYEENMWVLNMCISIGYIFIVICTLISKSKNVYIIYTLYIYTYMYCAAPLPSAALAHQAGGLNHFLEQKRRDSHTIHGTGIGIFTDIYHTNQPKLGKW